MSQNASSRASPEDEVVDAVREHRRRRDLTRFVVRQNAREDVGRLLPQLAAVA